MRKLILKLVCASLLAGMVSCDSSTHSHQETPTLEDSTGPSGFHSLKLVVRRTWIDGAPPITFCNGIDSAKGDTTFFTFWGLLGDRDFGDWAFTWTSNDTATFLLFPESTNSTVRDTSRILPRQFVYALDSFPSNIRFLTFRPTPNAKRLSSSDSARGYLDLSVVTTIPRATCAQD